MVAKKNTKAESGIQFFSACFFNSDHQCMSKYLVLMSSFVLVKDNCYIPCISLNAQASLIE